MKDIRPQEHAVQHEIVQCLRRAGAIVKETTAYKQKQSSGMDKGIPDLLVYCEQRPQIYMGLEIKRDAEAATNELTPEQRIAIERREYPAVWKPKQALDFYIRFLQDGVGTADALGKAYFELEQLEAA